MICMLKGMWASKVGIFLLMLGCARRITVPISVCGPSNASGDEVHAVLGSVPKQVTCREADIQSGAKVSAVSAEISTTGAPQIKFTSPLVQALTLVIRGCFASGCDQSGNTDYERVLQPQTIGIYYDLPRENHSIAFLPYTKINKNSLNIS